MKRIIVDHFTRRWFVWGWFCILSLGAGLTLAGIGIIDPGTIKDADSPGVIFFPILMAWLTAIAARLDWAYGYPRILLSLPFTARQIGRAVWWTGVGVPALLFALFSGVGVLILCRAGTQGRFLELWIKMVFGVGLFSGSIFWFCSGPPSLQGGPWRKRFLVLYSWAFLFGLVGGIYLLYKSAISIESKSVIAYFWGLVFTVPGWLRAEGLVVDYGSYRRETAGAGHGRGKFKPRSGFGGAPYLLMRFFASYLRFALIVLPILVVGSIWINHRFSPGDFVSKEGLPLQIGFQLWFYVMCIFQTITLGANLKLLRSMPLTSIQLSATILSLMLLPILILAGLCIPLFLMKLGLPAVFSLLKCYLLGLLPVCVITTASVWNSEKRFWNIVNGFLAFVVLTVPLIYQLVTTNWDSGRGGLPTWIIIALPVAAVFFALFTISRLLERNEMTYRLKVDPSFGRS